MFLIDADETAATLDDATRAWHLLRAQAAQAIAVQPGLDYLIDASVFERRDLGAAMAVHIVNLLVPQDALHCDEIREVLLNLSARPELLVCMAADLEAVVQRDPAFHSELEVMLFAKGFAALQVYRFAHVLLRQGRRLEALYLQARSNVVLGIDIHPACCIGRGVMLDHGTGIVIGETAVVENHVSILQGVTLGGTGKDSGDRHPKVRTGVMIGSGAKILGNIEIGAGSKIGANGVVLKPVPARSTVVGVPACGVGQTKHAQPAEEMDQSIS